MKKKILSFMLILTLVISTIPFSGIDFENLKASYLLRMSHLHVILLHNSLRQAVAAILLP